MREIMSLYRRIPTLGERYSASRNSFGLLRLVLACGVLVAHAWPIGFAEPSLGAYLSSGQSDLGTFSVQGFFVLSGFLVTGSALGSSLRRYAWHRFLRIFPGLWVCLFVTAFVFAPLIAYYERGTLAGFWTHPQGPFSYVATNVLASMEQYPISGLLSDTPYGHVVGGPSAFDGSLWSLRYEFGCYFFLAVLIATAVLRRAPRALLVLTAICYALILRDLLTASSWTIRPPQRDAIGSLPLIGAFAADWVLYLGFLFLLGATARIYLNRVPMHWSLAVLAGAALVGSLWQGAYIAIGLPAYAYLLLYVAVALPGPLTRIGRGRDYSYGMYIYAFPVQQALALIGGAAYGLTVYILLSLVGTLLLAMLSWHLVERPALALKHRPLQVRYRQRHGRPAGTRFVPTPASAPATPSVSTSGPVPASASVSASVSASESASALSEATRTRRASRHAVARRSAPRRTQVRPARTLDSRLPRYDLSYKDIARLLGHHGVEPSRVDAKPDRTSVEAGRVDVKPARTSAGAGEIGIEADSTGVGADRTGALR